MQIRSDLEVFETLPVPLCVVRGDEVLYANRALVELTGIEPSELRATGVVALVARFTDPDDVPWLCAISDARGTGTEPPPALWTRMIDGRHVCVRMARVAGSADEWLCLLIDGDAEAICRQLSSVLADAASAFMRCRDEAAVLDCAVGALELQGLRAAILFCHGDDLRLCASTLRPAERTRIEQIAGVPAGAVRLPLVELPAAQALLAQGRTFFAQDARVSLGSLGSVRPIVEALLVSPRVFVAPIPLEEGPFGLLVVQGDSLSPSAAALLELFAGHAGAALENARHHKRAAQRLKELTQLQDELVAQERSAAVGGAAAVLAHEVRNPLGAILNAAALLKRGGSARFDPAELLAMIEEEAERIDHLIGDLLQVARPLEPRLRPVELGPLVARAIAAVCEDGVNVAVELVGEVGGALVSADPNLVQVAVENLVRNALQSSPDGGRVAVRIDGDESRGAVVVEDDGPGIEAPDAQRIFEPFWTTRQTGRGLGLAVVKRVAEVHGGTVEVRRREGGGCVFELRLPRGEEPLA